MENEGIAVDMVWNEYNAKIIHEENLVLCQDLKQIKMRIFHREINICSLSCIYAII